MLRNNKSKRRQRNHSHQKLVKIIRLKRRQRLVQQRNLNLSTALKKMRSREARHQRSPQLLPRKVHKSQLKKRKRRKRKSQLLWERAIERRNKYLSRTLKIRASHPKKNLRQRMPRRLQQNQRLLRKLLKLRSRVKRMKKKTMVILKRNLRKVGPQNLKSLQLLLK